MPGVDPSIRTLEFVVDFLNISGFCAATDARVEPGHEAGFATIR
jgi:hypothetical protein